MKFLGNLHELSSWKQMLKPAIVMMIIVLSAIHLKSYESHSFLDFSLYWWSIQLANFGRKRFAGTLAQLNPRALDRAICFRLASNRIKIPFSLLRFGVVAQLVAPIHLSPFPLSLALALSFLAFLSFSPSALKLLGLLENFKVDATFDCCKTPCAN